MIFRVCLPLAESLGGAAGKGIAAVLSAFSIPTFNILAVIALTMFLDSEDGHKANLKDVLIKIAKNPLIIGVACVLTVLGIRSLVPVNADGSLVFSLSGSLKFFHDAVGNLAKISSPLALVILGGLFGSPVAVSSAIMAQEMDNDGTLAGQLVVRTSILSIFTIFLAVFILRAMQLL